METYNKKRRIEEVEAEIAIFDPTTRENLELMRILKDSSGNISQRVRILVR